jgi:hypothetical protein
VFVGQNSHSAVVVHCTAGPETWTAQDLGDYFRTTANMTSSHFGIDRDGVICQYVSLADGAAANCCLEDGHDSFWDQFGGDNLNKHTISIEHVNDATNSLPLTDAQKLASFKLIAWLCERYSLTFEQVKTHARIAPRSRPRCPGPAFPLNELKTFLNGGPMKRYLPHQGDFDIWFVANPDGTWTCKSTGAVLMGANLALYQTLSIDGLTLPVIGLPLESEQYHKDPDGYSWSTQRCERAQMTYDPEHRKDAQPGFGPSYLAHIKW